MTQITPLLRLEHVPTGVQLHLTDAYGHSNAVVELGPQETEALFGDLLTFLAPEDGETIDIESVELTDWDASTKAEIVAAVKTRFGVDLDPDLLKADLVEQATAAELTFHAS